jgi:HAD superfamily hydrolase (TIGR01549 family)
MIKLAIFDMDGTVFESYLNWQEIRAQLEIKEGDSILKTIYQDNRVDEFRLKILEEYEKENTFKTKPIIGAAEFLSYLRTQGIVTVLITNNNRENTDFLLNKFDLCFDLVITREMRLWKPEPDGLIYVMNLYKCEPGEVISIGDSHYDIKASQGARVSHIYIIKGDHVDRLSEAGITYFEDYFDLKRIFTKEHNKSCRHVDIPVKNNIDFLAH